MAPRRRTGVRSALALAVVGVFSAAAVAAQPAAAGNGNGNGNAYGQAKKQAPPPTDPGSTDPGSTDPGSTEPGPTDPVTPSVQTVNSLDATLAFVDAAGKRATVGTDFVQAVITITNTSTGTPAAALGSANITVSGFRPCSSTFGPQPCPHAPVTDGGSGWNAIATAGPNAFTSLIQLRSTSGPAIPAGSSITISTWMKSTAPCNADNGLAWPVAGRTSSNFIGGTLFNAVSTMPLGSLQITTQPPLATQYNSDMFPPPQVTSFNPCGVASPPAQPVSLTDALSVLTGGTSRSATGNVTTFGALRFTTFDVTDSLTASASGYTPSDASNSFLVAEKVQSCTSDNCPTLNLNSQPKTNALITPTAGNTDALVSGSALNPDTSLCGEGASGLSSSEVSSTIAVDAPVAKTVTFTIAKALVHAISNNGTPFMNVCMRVVNTDGSVTDKDLPNCSVGVDACVVSRGKNKANEVIVVRLPVGDPHFNVH